MSRLADRLTARWWAGLFAAVALLASGAIIGVVGNAERSPRCKGVRSSHARPPARAMVRPHSDSGRCMNGGTRNRTTDSISRRENSRPATRTPATVNSASTISALPSVCPSARGVLGLVRYSGESRRASLSGGTISPRLLHR